MICKTVNSINTPSESIQKIDIETETLQGNKAFTDQRSGQKQGNELRPICWRRPKRSKSGKERKTS